MTPKKSKHLPSLHYLQLWGIGGTSALLQLQGSVGTTECVRGHLEHTPYPRRHPTITPLSQHSPDNTELITFHTHMQLQDHRDTSRVCPADRECLWRQLNYSARIGTFSISLSTIWLQRSQKKVEKESK